MEKTGRGEWSYQNRQILESYAKKILEPYEIDYESSDQLIHLIYKSLPKKEDAIKETGLMLSASYGIKFFDVIINAIASGIFRIQPRNWSQSIGTSYHTAVHMAQSAISPSLLPFAKTFGLVLGGLSLPATVAFANLLYKRAFPKKSFDLTAMETLQNYVKLVENNEIEFPNGERLTERDIRDIKKSFQKFDVIYKVLKSSPQDFEKTFFIQRDDGVLCFRDGNLVPRIQRRNTKPKR